MKTTMELPAPIAVACQQGYEAYKLDRSKYTNPHGGPEFFAWHCGWHEARAEEADAVLDLEEEAPTQPTRFASSLGTAFDRETGCRLCWLSAVPLDASQHCHHCALRAGMDHADLTPEALERIFGEDLR